MSTSNNFRIFRAAVDGHVIASSPESLCDPDELCRGVDGAWSNVTPSEWEWIARPCLLGTCDHDKGARTNDVQDTVTALRELLVVLGRAAEIVGETTAKIERGKL